MRRLLHSKALSLLLTAAMVLSLVPAFSLTVGANVGITSPADLSPKLVVRKDNPQPADSPEALSSPTLDDSTTAWFGGYQWVIIGWDEDGVASKADTATLLFANANATKPATAKFHGSSNQYAGSTLQTAINDTFYNTITDAREKSAIAPRSLTGNSGDFSYGYDEGITDKSSFATIARKAYAGAYVSHIFTIDGADTFDWYSYDVLRKNGNIGSAAYTGSYHPDNIAGSDTTGDNFWSLSIAEASLLDGTIRTYDAPWWLLSPGISGTHAAVVNFYGDVFAGGNSVNIEHALRPAFNLDLTSVLFASAAVGGKSDATVGSVLMPAEPAAQNLKFTVLDSTNLSLSVAAGEQSARRVKSGGTVDIEYSGAQTAANKFVSCVIVDDNGDITHYGKLSTTASGTASFEVPTLTEGNYTIKLFNEECNGDYFTDFSSTPIAITMTVDNTAPEVSIVSPSGTGVAITTNTLSVTFGEEMNVTSSPSIIGTVSLDNSATLSGGTWQADNKTIQYTLSDLAYGTEYTYAISGFQDAAGNEMTAVTTGYTFTTETAPALGQVTGATLSDTGLATWTNLTSETGLLNYSVQLYKNGTALGSPETSNPNTGATGVSFLSEMRTEGVGSYTVTVTAIGNGTTHSNGTESTASAPQSVVKLSAPSNLGWSGTDAVFDKLADETNVEKYIITLTGSGTIGGNSTADVAKTGGNLSVAVDNPAVGDTFTVKAIVLTAGMFLDSDASSASAGYAVPNTAPSFTVNPSNQNVTEGNNVSFTVAANGNPTPTYQWQENSGSDWNNISNGGVYSGATTATLTLTGVTLGMNGYQYRCSASNSMGTVESTAVTLTVNALPVKTVSVGTQNGTLTAGTAGSVSFEVTTENITSGTAITLNNANGITGITLVTTATSGNNTTVTISTTAATPQGSHPLTLTIYGVTSGTFYLVVNAPAQTNHTVTFINDGAIYTTRTTASGSALGINWPSNPGKTDYRFDGWFYGGVQYYAHTPITGNITLTARWTYTGNDHGGNPDPNPTPTYPPVVITPPPTPPVIKVGDTEMPYTKDKDGLVTVSPNEKQIQDIIKNAQGGTVVFDFSAVPGITGISFKVDPAWFKNAGDVMVLAANGYSLTIQDGMMGELVNKYGGYVEFTIKIGSIAVSITQDGKPIDWYSYEFPMTVSMPVSNGGSYTVMRNKATNAVIARSWYADGQAHAKVYRTGTFEAVTLVPAVFTDTTGKWMNEAAAYTSARGVVSGIGNNLFAPETNVTRAEFLTMLMRALNPEPQGTQTIGQFSDVPMGTYYYIAVLKARQLGIVSGHDNKFNPTDTITRQDMFVMLYNAMNVMNMLPAATTQQWAVFADWDDVAGYAGNPIQTLARMGMVSGKGGGVLDPKGTATRAEAVQVIFNLFRRDED